MITDRTDGYALHARGRWLRATVSTRSRCLVENIPTDTPQGRALRRIATARDHGHLDEVVAIGLAANILDAVRALRLAGDAATEARLEGTDTDPVLATQLARRIGDATGDLEDAVARTAAAIAEARRMRSRTYPKSREVRAERAAANARSLRNQFVR